MIFLCITLCHRKMWNGVRLVHKRTRNQWYSLTLDVIVSHSYHVIPVDPWFGHQLLHRQYGAHQWRKCGNRTLSQDGRQPGNKAVSCGMFLAWFFLILITMCMLLKLRNPCQKHETGVCKHAFLCLCIVVPYQ